MPSRSVARRPLDEFRFIEQLVQQFGRTGPSVIRGIGDDAAIVRSVAGRELLVTADLLIEHVHFDFTTATFEDVGYKAAVANLSDIAAMGGRPDYLITTTAIPSSYTQPEMLRLYRGMMGACREYGVRLIGGDTSRSPRDVFIGIIMIGSVPTGRALTRAGARPGDLLYVTGTLGDSLAGFELLAVQKKATNVTNLPDRVTRYLLRRHRRPTPWVREAQWLSRRRLASAAIDLSDGLSGDFVHLCEQSGVGAEIEAAALPISIACRKYAEAGRLDATRLALKGGEDYELLFTVSPRKQAALARAMRRAGITCSRIGAIRRKSFGIRLRSGAHASRPLPVLSFRHFQKA